MSKQVCASDAAEDSFLGNESHMQSSGEGAQTYTQSWETAI